MPIQGRLSDSPSTACCMIGRARLMGMAKPMPCASPAMAVLMPMSAPPDIHERAAAVAGVDGRVGLDEVAQRLDLAGAAALVVDVDAPAHGAHDARGHRVREGPEGAADGDGALPDLERARVADLHGRQVRALDLHDGEVRERVQAMDGALVVLAVGQLDGQRVGVADHMAVGDDPAVRVVDDARADALGVDEGTVAALVA